MSVGNNTDENIKCDICDETKRSKVTGMTLTVHREDPEAYGYPEVVYWKDEYKFNKCPGCGRKIK